MRSLRLALVGVPLAAGACAALAAVPEAFTTAVASITADGVSMAGALVGVGASVVAVMIALKFVKRLRGAV